jgi:DNA-binding Lrp family transcriptional regulator
MTKAYVAIHCQTGKENQIIRSLLEMKGVSEVTGVLGLYDIIIKIEAEDSMKIEQIITKKIRTVPYVITTMTLIVV